MHHDIGGRLRLELPLRLRLLQSFRTIVILVQQLMGFMNQDGTLDRIRKAFPDDDPAAKRVALQARFIWLFAAQGNIQLCRGNL